MMGAGKTTVGKLLAARLGRPFADTDAIIEAQAGMTVAKLFESEGERAFRERERALIGELERYRGYVLALGGRMFYGDFNVKAIRRKALTIWLRARPGSIADRLRLTDLVARPVLAGDATTLESTIADLIGHRAFWYAKAHLTFNTDDLEPAAIAEGVAEMLDAPCG